MRVHWNRKEMPFIFVEPNGSGKAEFITPRCELKTLELSTFQRHETLSEDKAISEKKISSPQIEKYIKIKAERKEFEKTIRATKRRREWEELPWKKQSRYIEEQIQKLSSEKKKELANIIGAYFVEK